ncbi:MAG: hypothetical protein EOS73_34785 [Mesorhizobium sp.]|uniref:hypothetical protein n=1 Tax=Mesorhizobium sp. M7A.F.Ca.ET.027.02.1.1 TaxID=2496655 RepID=UPI000FD3DB18|nr:hypothetical protein [Mesorhizobium sp. M7A.F.Ca.ET.027.02.1.1]RVD13952.1 hypothetical protein EN749_21620 [Mesorhizobium sp. M7A.F.Ca.ET.027.02.1.1]RWC94574.1 MAG: hypothetical protein EOS73_34785 [Mesorhizobium sp.]
MSSYFREVRDRKIRGNREYRVMSDPQYELRIYLQHELARRPHGTKGQLAKFLGVKPDAVTRMTNTDPGKETRAIQAHEFERIRQFFNDAGAPAGPIRDAAEIQNMLERIEGLSPTNVETLLSMIQQLRRVSAEEPSRNQPDGQSEPATVHRESTP